MKGLGAKLKARWANYQPNKQSLYKSAGYTVALVVGLGFTVGGWTTAGSAEKMAHEARVDYAATLCAERFLAADQAGQRLADLKRIVGRHQRGRALEKAGWPTLPAGTTPQFADQARLACGERLNSAQIGAGVDGSSV